jgi:hypothetical protein
LRRQQGDVQDNKYKLESLAPFASDLLAAAKVRVL